jgi:starvation-inducible outer membrane lipoprotein
VRRVFIAIAVWPILLSACASPVFPLKAMDGVDPTFDFSRWRMAPDPADTRKIQLGGRILSSTTQGEMLTIVVAQLPIVEHPVYGPKETDKPTGEFVVLYRQMVDARFLQPGNHIMAVGETSPSMQVDVGGTLLSLPALTALCIHFWNRSGNDIVMIGSTGAGTKTFTELTYCMTSF